MTANLTTDDKFVMVLKARPTWQKGRYNFPGGKLEEAELIFAAASREFAEETAIKIRPSKWFKSAELVGLDWTVYVMRTSERIDETLLSGQPDEPVTVHRLEEIIESPHMYIENVAWLAAHYMDHAAPLIRATYEGA
jgi:8-oxo-dGTP pyrophosphatase MutT (NUDIX family)